MSNQTRKQLAEICPVDQTTTRLNPIEQEPRTILREFGLNTSTHGIPGITRSESIPNRLYWTICLLLFTGIMTYFITESIKSYFKYPTQVVISVNLAPTDVFPAVSVCNYASIRYDYFIEPFLNYTNHLNLTNTTDTTTFSSEQAEYIADFLIDQLNNNYSIKDYFYPIESMLLSCRYNNINCSSKDFVSFITPEHGQCYTFNAKSKNASDSNNANLRTMFDNGSYGVLEMEWYIHRHQYVPYFTKGAGLIIAMHDNHQMPFMFYDGYYLRPGQIHRVSYVNKFKSRLGDAYRECENRIPLQLQTVFDQFSLAEYKYGQTACYFACIQTYVYDACGCVDPSFWIFRYFVRHGTMDVIKAPICNQKNVCYQQASQTMMNDDNYWSTNCSDCTNDCNTTDFIPKISSLEPMFEWIINDLKTKVETLGMPLPRNWSQTWQQDIEKSYVAIEVVTETSRSEKYNEEASMTGTDLLSNVGGQTGLWIGISFLSFMEILEMIYRLVRYYCSQLYRRIRPNEIVR